MAAETYEILRRQEQHRTEYNQLKLAIAHEPTQVKSFLQIIMAFDSAELSSLFQEDSYQFLNCFYHSSHRDSYDLLQYIELIKKLPQPAQHKLLVEADFFKNLEGINSKLMVDFIQIITSGWADSQQSRLYLTLLYKLPFHDIKYPRCIDCPPLNMCIAFITKKLSETQIDRKTFQIDYRRIFSNGYIWMNDEAIDHLLKILFPFYEPLARYIFDIRLDESPFHYICKTYPQRLKTLLQYTEYYFFEGFYHYLGAFSSISTYPPFLEYLRYLNEYPEQATNTIFKTLYDFPAERIKRILFSEDRKRENIIQLLSNYPQKFLPLIPHILLLDRTSQVQIFKYLQPKKLFKVIEEQLAQHLLELASLIVERNLPDGHILHEAYCTLRKGLEEYNASPKSPKNCQTLHTLWVDKTSQIKDELYTYQNTGNVAANLLLCSTFIGFLALLARYVYYNLIEKSHCMFFIPIVSSYKIRNDLSKTLQDYESMKPN